MISIRLNKAINQNLLPKKNINTKFEFATCSRIKYPAKTELSIESYVCTKI